MKRSLALGSFGFVALGLAPAAFASSGIDSPENGVVQMGRGSAWVAKADDPLAAHYNPAGLATQATGVHIGASLMFQTRCFSRVNADGSPVSPSSGLAGPGAANGPPAELCNHGFTPNPQVAFAYRITPRLALGVAVVAPHAVGDNNWGETVSYVNSFGANTVQPAASRYMMVSSSGVILEPTVSVAYSPFDGLSFGAGFVWGIVTADQVNFAEAVSPKGSTTDDFATHGDTRAELKVADLFVPGFVLGLLWNANANVDVGASFKYLSPVDTTGDLNIKAAYFDSSGAPKADPCAGVKTCTDAKDVGHLTFNIPLEARIGSRFHVRREGGPRPAWSKRKDGGKVVDSLSEDLFDVEVDLTWAHNSAVDKFQLRFPGAPNAVPLPPGTVPVNGDLIRNWKDVVGVRLGGDYIAIPNRLALRGGGWFETKGVDDKDLQLDFDLAQKFGLALGATVRVGPVDISAAYQHTFYGTLDNCSTANGKTSCNGEVRALSGDATSGFRSVQTVNNGKLAESLNEFALGGTLRF